MRSLGAALLLFAVLSASAQQPEANSAALSGRLSIPVELAKTVRADKVHAGDVVEFRSLEAVLAGNGVVIPANCALYGRVLSAAAKQNNRNSYLAVVVERAEWKDHTLPLHAFISAQINVTRKSTRVTDPESGMDPPTPRRPSRQSVRVAAASDPELSNVVRAPRDATITNEPGTGTKYPALENVGFFRDKDGTTYLLSSKANVKLPAGVLLMLQNQPVPIPPTAAPNPANNGSQARP